MADREFRFDFLARDGVTPVVKRVGDAVDDLGDDMRGTTADAKRLDDEIDDVKRSLLTLAAAFAATDDAASRVDLTKAMRRQQTELRKLTNVSNLLPDGDSIGIGERIVGSIRAAMPAASSVLVGGIAAMAPLIGATIAGAVVGAAGAGGIIGGVLLAAQDSRVHVAAASLGEFVSKELEKSAAPFVPAVLTVIGKAKAAFVAMGADLRGIFADSAKLLGPLSDGIIGLVSRTMPGIRAAVANAGPVFGVLAKELPELGQSIGNFFRLMGEHAQQGAAGLKVVFDILEAGIDIVGKVSAFFGDLFQGVVWGALKVVEALIWVHDTWSQLWGDDSKSEPLAKMKQNLTELNDGMSQVGSGFRKRGEDATLFAQKTTDAAAKVRTMKEALDELTNQNLSFFDAQTKAAHAVDAATEAIKKNGRTHDENTAKGNANRQALSSVAHGFNEVQASAEASGQSAQAVNGIYERQRRQLITLAQSMDYSSGEARDLADSILAIPKNRTTTFDAIDNASWVAQRVNRAISSIQRGVTIGINAALAGAKAEGGPVSKGKAYLVGEKRPEVFVPDRDGVIIPSIDQARSQGVMSSGGSPAPVSSGGGSPTVVLDIRSGGSRLDDLLVELLQNAVRVRGGNVQTVLGKG